jgi:hypothetical protein
MHEVLVVLHPSISPSEREAVAKIAPAKGAVSNAVFIADDPGAGPREQLRALRGVARVLTGGESADALPRMTDAETLFVQAWLSPRGQKSRRGEGLDWDTPPMVPPDRPR